MLEHDCVECVPDLITASARGRLRVESCRDWARALLGTTDSAIFSRIIIFNKPQLTRKKETEIMEEKLLAVEEYARKIENELREIADFENEENSKIAHAFAKVRI